MIIVLSIGSIQVLHGGHLRLLQNGASGKKWQPLAKYFQVWGAFAIKKQSGKL